jgi:hypothetical protein
MVHIADEKLAARGIGAYARRTLQPLGGRKNKGGQRCGEMETIKTIMALTIIVMLSTLAMAAPTGPNAITRESDSRRDTFSNTAQEIEAQAGNVTRLEINATVQTNRWQGYYGNITGQITLDDAGGNTLYDWEGDDISVVGEIYAANQTVSDWSDVICVNLNGNGNLADQGINLTLLELQYNMESTAADGFDETFDSTEDIVIGTTTLSACPATNTYVNNNSQSLVFNQTLLTENATGTVIFASKTENNEVGFNGETWDFQMIVAEDGSTDEAETYSFYVELA